MDWNKLIAEATTVEDLKNLYDIYIRYRENKIERTAYLKQKQESIFKELAELETINMFNPEYKIKDKIADLVLKK